MGERTQCEENSNIEIRNSTQIQMTKNRNYKDLRKRVCVEERTGEFTAEARRTQRKEN